MPFHTQLSEFGFLDRFFADSTLKKAGSASEDAALSLARLMAASRAGNLCQTEAELGIGVSSFPSQILEEGQSLYPKAPVVRWKNRYYLQKNWVYETHIIQHVLRLRGKIPSWLDLKRFEENLGSASGKLLPSQARAVRSSAEQGISFISGGPGTGKTYTAAHLVKLLFASMKKEAFHVCVAAPTGKAASHLRSTLEAHGCSDPDLHIEASTLHKLLKLRPGSNRLFSGDKIDADLIIADEASMIDVSLMAHLFEAAGDETLLVLIGDPNQLPPVDAGSVFPELSERFGIKLDRCMRTEDLGLQSLAEAVLRGDAEALFQIQPISNDPVSSEILYREIDPIVSAGEPDPQKCLEDYGRFRVLNAVRQGPQGTDSLNAELFEKLKKTGKWWAAPILATVNDSFTEIYNGMSGLLIGRGGKTDAAYFPDTGGALRKYPIPPPYELAFCLSIHKSQGSEFDEVLALFPEGSEHFGREALYTAITRAKKRLQIQGDQEILRRMTCTTSRIVSGIADRLAIQYEETRPELPAAQERDLGQISQFF